MDDLGLLQTYLVQADRNQMDSVKNADALQSVLKFGTTLMCDNNRGSAVAFGAVQCSAPLKLYMIYAKQ